MFASRPILRFSPFDAIPAFSGVGIVGLILWTFLAFDSLPVWALGLSFVAVMGSYIWNLQCISHNFIHNPFFRNRWLNRAYSVLETLALGVPHILYHHYHLNHHAGDNDMQGADGTTRDWSSTYRYGKNGQPEAFWRYCLLSFFRVELAPVVRTAAKHGQAHVWQTVVEFVVLGVFWVVMAAVNWRYFVFFYLPSYYLGWVLSYAEGYLEHHGTQPGNPFANSVSSYNRLYNFFWFNNGYHQEHHWDPKMHWTKMKELHARIRPQLEVNHTRIYIGPHLTGMIEEFITRRRETLRPLPSIEADTESALRDGEPIWQNTATFADRVVQESY
jgi:fatty acid desaturase